MASLRLSFADSAAEHIKTDQADWLIYGTDSTSVAETIGSGTNFGTVVNKVTSLPGEYSLIAVEKGPPTVVRAYRGITSSFDVFYCRRPSDGTIIVGDHFRNVLAELPTSDRTVADSVATDQLLFGTKPQGTYVEEVERLGHGETLEWEVDGSPRVEQFESLSVDETISPSEAKQRLNRYFSDAIDEGRFEESVVTMLSGGVDSTLIQSYLDTDATVSAAFDSPEFGTEVDYARRASELLGSDHQLIELDEDEFCDYVEKATAATGYPLQHLQATLMYATVSETPYQVYLNGQLADGLFGTGNAALAHLSQYIGRFVHLLPSVAPEIDKLAEVAKGMRAPVTDPNGLAMSFVIHTDEDRVADILSEEAIRERKKERLHYTRKRVDVDDDRGYASHMHLGHFIDFFQDNTVTPWRHAAHAAGKTLFTPFADRKVIETLLKVPASKRYARFAVPPKNDPKLVTKRKYLLKELLENRIPEYNTRKAKGSSALPLHRYFEDGPLSNVFDRYSIPDFVPDEKQSLIRDGADHISWYAFSYAVWEKQILENENLELLEKTSMIEM
ncbi:asparagine synthetase B family protein [Halobacterium salinarum]|uniref:asparagine synthase-related protein n=1 Tax=Halobacterium salinarum TaxID=2242 RepID=UPI002556DB29|nr:asparagine synthetase B family protein [Halobacterium salinarum]MDL0126515.1 asparagine synthase-related protein [Halobacterium salinarum]